MTSRTFHTSYADLAQKWERIKTGETVVVDDDELDAWMEHLAGEDKEWFYKVRTRIAPEYCGSRIRYEAQIHPFTQEALAETHDLPGFWYAFFRRIDRSRGETDGQA